VVGINSNNQHNLLHAIYYLDSPTVVQMHYKMLGIWVIVH